MMVTGSYAPGRPQPRPGPGRVVFALALGIAIAFGLYWAFGRNEPVPPWVALPEGSSVKVSRSAPAAADESAGAAAGGVRYYLQARVPHRCSTALLQVSGSISGARWEAAVPRPATRADLITRSGWPSWVQDKLYHVKDAASGVAMISRTPGEQLYLYAWPVENGSIVELVQEGGARQPATPGVETGAEP